MLKPGQKTSFRVKGTLDAYAIKLVALIPMGQSGETDGAFIMPVNAIMRRGIRKEAGATVRVELAADNDPMLISADLMTCLADDPAALQATLDLAVAQADVVLTSGGVSVGEADHTRAVLARMGEVAFWKVAMRPGRPFAFGPLRRTADLPPTWLFALPGNPVAALVTFYAFAREALMQLAGATPQPLPVLQARCSTAIRKRPGRTEFQRAVVEWVADESGADGLANGRRGGGGGVGRNGGSGGGGGGSSGGSSGGGSGGDSGGGDRRGPGSWQVRLTGSQGAGVLRSMSEANALLVLHHEQGSVEAGDLVDVWLFEGLV